MEIMVCRPNPFFTVPEGDCLAYTPGHNLQDGTRAWRLVEDPGIGYPERDWTVMYLTKVRDATREEIIKVHDLVCPKCSTGGTCGARPGFYESLWEFKAKKGIR